MWLKIQGDSSSLKKLRETALSAVIKYSVSGAAFGPRSSYTATGPESLRKGALATFYIHVQTLLNMKTCKMFCIEIKQILKLLWHQVPLPTKVLQEV